MLPDIVSLFFQFLSLVVSFILFLPLRIIDTIEENVPR